MENCIVSLTSLTIYEIVAVEGGSVSCFDEVCFHPRYCDYFSVGVLIQ